MERSRFNLYADDGWVPEAGGSASGYGMTTKVPRQHHVIHFASGDDLERRSRDFFGGLCTVSTEGLGCSRVEIRPSNTIYSGY